jgi:hypothetical protein
VSVEYTNLLNTIDNVTVYSVDINQIKSKNNLILIQMLTNKKNKIVATLGLHAVQENHKRHD